MSFDAITFGAVNKLKPIVGSLQLVGKDFKTEGTRYIETGVEFDPAEYPKLAAVSEVGYKGDVFNEMPLAAYSGTDTVLTALYSTLGYAKTSFILGGETYVLFQYGQLYKTTNGDISTLEYFKSFVAAQVGNYPFNCSYASVQNNYLYLSLPHGVYRVDLADTSFDSIEAVTVPTSMRTNGNIQVKYGNGLYLAIATGITGTSIGTSADGITFTSRSISLGSSLWNQRGIEYGNGIWVVTTSGTAAGNVSTSPDGVTWTQRSAGTVGLNLVRYSSTANIFVAQAVGTASATGYYTSVDGVTWTVRTRASTAFTYTHLEVSALGFISYSQASSGATAVIEFSADGITWSSKTNGAFSSNSRLGVCWSAYPSDDRVLIIGFSYVASTNGGNNAASYVVANGAFASYSTASDIKGFGTGVLSAPLFITGDQIGLMVEQTNNSVSSYGARKVSGLRTEDGGATWQPFSYVLGTSIYTVYGVYVSPSRFVVHYGAPNGNGYISTSVDGLTWTSRQISSGNLTGVLACTNDIVVAQGVSTAVSVSSDFGTSWLSMEYALSTSYSIFATKNNFLFVNPAGVSYLTSITDPIAVQIGLPTIAGATVGTYTYSDGVAMLTLNATNQLYVSFDDGFTWEPRTLPVYLTKGAISIFKSWTILSLSNGVAYRSGDYGITWHRIEKGLHETEYTWSHCSVNQAKTKAYFGGKATKLSGYYLEASTEHNSIGFVPAPYANSKWIVRAKK